MSEPKKAEMQLLVSITSPFARKTRIVALEKKFSEEELEFVDANPWVNNAGVVDHNPLNKVPTLLVGGQTMWDSKVIAAFLDEKKPQPRLLPEAPKERQRALAFEVLADGATDSITAYLMAKRVSGEEPQAVWRDWLFEKAQRVQARFAKELKGREFLLKEMSLADIALACHLAFVDFRLPDFGWREKHPELAKWHDKLAKRYSFAKTAPDR